MRLDVEQLGFFYDARRTILEDVTFSLAGTGIYCILGKNGTGKSTLLKCIVGEHGGTGRVLLDGKERGAYGQRNSRERSPTSRRTTRRPFLSVCSMSS